MDARRPCPDSALLAAFLDGTLAEYERTAVVAHLADCPECRAVAVTVVEFGEVAAHDTLWDPAAAALPSAVPATGRVSRWTREKTRAPSRAAVAAIAVVAISISAYFSFFFLDSRRSHPSPHAVSTLVSAVEGIRLTRARFSSASESPSVAAGANLADFSFARFQQTAAALRASGEGDYGASSRRVVGLAALLTGDLDEAVESLRMAASADTANAQVANDLATAYYERFARRDRADDLPAALSAVERALRIEPAFPEALFNRALIITALGLWSEARPAWDAYLRVDRQSDWAAEARTYLQQVQRRLAEPDEWDTLRQSMFDAGNKAALRSAARDHAARARDVFDNQLLKQWTEAVRRNAPRDATLARMSALAEALLQESGDRLYHDLALRLVRLDAAPVARQQAIVVGYDRLFEGVGLVSTNRIDAGVDTLRDARHRLRSADSPLELRAAIEIATGDYLAGRYEAVIAALPALRDSARARRYRTLAARASWILGLAHVGREDFAAAELAYEDTRREATATHDGETRAAAAVLLANLHWMTGDRARAWRYRNEAAALLESGVSIGTRMNVLLGSAGDALAAGDYETALLFQGAILNRGVRLNPVTEAQAHTQRAVAWHRMDRGRDALSELEAARRLVPAIADSRLHARVEADILTAEAEIRRQDDPAAAIALARRALAIADISTDRLRIARLQLRLAEALLTRGELDAADRAVADGIAALEQHRAAAVGLPVLGASDSAWLLYTRAVEIALRQNDLRKAFYYADRGRVSTGFDRHSGPATAQLPDIQQQLPADTALVVLNQFDAAVDVWIVRQRTATRYPVSLSRSRANRLVTAHLDEIGRRVAAPAIGAELFEALLEPGRQTLQGSSTLIVIADAPYLHMAAAALYDGERGRFLIEDFKVLLAPSATDYVRGLAAPGATKPPNLRRAAVLPAQPGEPTSSIAAVTTAYSSATVRSPEHVTARRIVEDLHERDVLHIAAPMIGSSEFPALSHLVLADEAGAPHRGSVSAARLASIPGIKTQLVVLEHADPEGPTGALRPHMLARALLAAGVRHVVTPVAPLSAADAEATWRDFYREVAAGSSAVDSLRHAQLAALNASDRRAGPWAALTIFGAAQ